MWQKSPRKEIRRRGYKKTLQQSAIGIRNQICNNPQGDNRNDSIYDWRNQYLLIKGFL